MQSEREVNRAIERYSDMVRRICLIHLQNSADTEDIFQTVFLKYVLRSMPFENEEHEKAWLIRTAINYCKDVQKSFWKRKRNAYDAAAEQMLQSVQTPSEDREVLRAIWRLPPAHAELLYLHYYEGYSIEEIAVIMHKNASTLRSRLSRAKELLRKELGKDG